MLLVFLLAGNIVAQCSGSHFHSPSPSVAIIHMGLRHRLLFTSSPPTQIHLSSLVTTTIRLFRIRPHGTEPPPQFWLTKPKINLATDYQLRVGLRHRTNSRAPPTRKRIRVVFMRVRFGRHNNLRLRHFHRLVASPTNHITYPKIKLRVEWCAGNNVNAGIWPIYSVLGRIEGSCFIARMLIQSNHVCNF